MTERMKDEAFLKEQVLRMDYAREFANKWHGSPDGIEWHRKHGKEVALKVKPTKHICEFCGKEYYVKPIGVSRFCSNTCKSKWRFRSGLDNETRVCLICGKEFEVNKYLPKKTCSRACANRLMSLRKTKADLGVY